MLLIAQQDDEKIRKNQRINVTPWNPVDSSSNDGGESRDDQPFSALDLEYRFRRRGKPDFAINPYWSKRPRVTWETQVTPTSYSLPEFLGGKPQQPFYPPPADVFIVGCLKAFGKQDDFVPRAARQGIVCFRRDLAKNVGKAKKAGA